MYGNNEENSWFRRLGFWRATGLSLLVMATVCLLSRGFNVPYYLDPGTIAFLTVAVVFAAYAGFIGNRAAAVGIVVGAVSAPAVLGVVVLAVLIVECSGQVGCP